MLDKVADINATGLDQWTALHLAADSGHLDIVEELLRQPDISIDKLSSIQRTPLHISAIKGYTQIARALIGKGANPNLKDSDQCTPLHYASEFGRIETVEYLLTETPATPYVKNNFGYIPSDIAQNLETK
jgi:ankyrin repeat protein